MALGKQEAMKTLMIIHLIALQKKQCKQNRKKYEKTLGFKKVSFKSCWYVYYNHLKDHK